jgi:uncharacterized protein (DUF885 family)
VSTNKFLLSSAFSCLLLIFGNNVIAATDVDPASQLNQFADKYFDAYFAHNPSDATSVGFHQYDNQFERYDRSNIMDYVHHLHEFKEQLSEIPRDKLNQLQQGDYDLLLADINSQLLTLETIRPWENNPDIYSSDISASAFTLMERTFASPEERLRSLIAREKQMPAALTAARENLKNPPPEFTEIALAQLPGIISFFEKDVPKVFASVKDPHLNKEFAKTNAEVISQLKIYQKWVKEDLQPKSKGKFQIGADTFSKKLQYDEMVDTPLDKILELGYADLRKNQAAFAQVAKEISPEKNPQQVLAEMQAEHPKPAQLLSTFKDTFSGLITFISQKHIISIPPSVQPTLEETPPFMRATTFASMDTPGPYETKATEAYFNVTLPEASWSDQQVAEYMSAFNVGTIGGTSIHEAYPGHYVQFLWVKKAPSKVRKLLGAMSNAEGWAHYCEQMMLDEGYAQPGVGAKNERDAKLMRLGQLQNALLRDARLVVGISMHTGKMSFKEGVDFFVKEGYQSVDNGHRETLRGTYNPTYLYYTLGKLEILKLREDVKQQRGPSFSLEQFHNAFMQQGFPPIKIVRRAMLGNDSPTL